MADDAWFAAHRDGSDVDPVVDGLDRQTQALCISREFVSKRTVIINDQ